MIQVTLNFTGYKPLKSINMKTTTLMLLMLCAFIAPSFGQGNSGNTPNNGHDDGAGGKQVIVFEPVNKIVKGAGLDFTPGGVNVTGVTEMKNRGNAGDNDPTPLAVGCNENRWYCGTPHVELIEADGGAFTVEITCVQDSNKKCFKLAR